MSEFEQFIHLLDTSSTARLIVIAIIVFVIAVLYILMRTLAQSASALKLVDSVTKANAATAAAQTATIASLTDLYGKMQAAELEQSEAIKNAGAAVEAARQALQATVVLLQGRTPVFELIKGYANEARLYGEAIWNQMGIDHTAVMNRFDITERNVLAAIQSLQTEDKLEWASAWIEFDERGEVVTASETARKVMGLEALSDEEFRTFRHHTKLVDIDGKTIPPEEWPVTKAIATRTSQASQFTGMRYKDHPMIWLLVSVDVKLDVIPTRAVAQLTDINKVMRLIERARRSTVEDKKLEKVSA